MRRLIILLVPMLTCSCAGMMQREHAMLREQYKNAEFLGIARTPQEADEYLKKNVDPATLKKWKRAVSDDTAIVELQYNQKTGELSGTVR